MNTGEIKHKYNLVAVIAAVGAVLALIGIVMAYMDPGFIDWFDLVVFALLVICAVQNIMPSIDKWRSILNIIIGIFAIIITSFDYIAIANGVEAESFMDVGYGIWIAFIGTILFTIFSISDYMYKRSE